MIFHLQDRVAHFIRNPALPTDQPLRGSWRYSYSFFYLILLKKHRLLFQTRVRASGCDEKRQVVMYIFLPKMQNKHISSHFAFRGENFLVTLRVERRLKVKG